MITVTPIAPETYRITPGRVLRSEWHKLWTLRSTWITLLAASGLTLGMGLMMGATYEPGGDAADMDVVVITLMGTQFAQVAIAVLGILTIAGEHAGGMIRASMTAVPRRTPVLWSKAAVFGSVAFAVTFLTHLTTFLAAQTLFSGTDQAASLNDPGVLRALAGSAAGLTLLGLIALGLGSLVRSVPGAIGAFVGGIMILPEVLTMLPYDIVRDAAPYFPARAVEALTTTQQAAGAASPGGALLALVLTAAVTLVTAGALTKRRDV
ncbi:ABC transporter permease [Streptomyces sp. NPDC000410]|uniref:ABC transporter permease n=1 Tax=Streptomyces sp. NPDC000410 TaxID=3154254 RepID=UPI00332FFA99